MDQRSREAGAWDETKGSVVGFHFTFFAIAVPRNFLVGVRNTTFGLRLRFTNCKIAKEYHQRFSVE